MRLLTIALDEGTGRERRERVREACAALVSRASEQLVVRERSERRVGAYRDIAYDVSGEIWFSYAWLGATLYLRSTPLVLLLCATKSTCPGLPAALAAWALEKPENQLSLVGPKATERRQPRVPRGAVYVCQECGWESWSKSNLVHVTHLWRCCQVNGIFCSDCVGDIVDDGLCTCYPYELRANDNTDF